MDRRTFLRLAGMAAAAPPVGALLSACGNPPTESTSAGQTATTAPGAGAAPGGSTNRKVRLGFIALTDCASIVMAKELGYFSERGLDVSVEKQASWAATRDNLLTHGIDEAILLADRIVVMGNPPGPSIIDVIPVDLPRPRDRTSVIDEPAYRMVQQRLMALLTAEEEAAA